MKDPKNEIDCVAFPDDGAHKRFGYMFAVGGALNECMPVVSSRATAPLFLAHFYCWLLRFVFFPHLPNMDPPSIPVRPVRIYCLQKEFPGIPQIVCGKTRDVNDPKKRTVVIKDGDCRGKHVIIVDDLVRTG